MAVYADRVKETTTTTGTGAYSLDGASAGFQSFVAGAGNGSVVTYAVENGTDWEISEGTVTDAATDTLSRTTVLASSNGGAAVNWGAGEKSIFLTASAARTVFNDKDNTLTGITSLPAGSAAAPSLTFAGDTNTGIYSTADVVNITAGGKTAAAFYHGNLAGNTDNTYIAFENYGGGGSFPDIVVKSDSANKALALRSKGSDQIEFHNGSGERMSVGGTGSQSLSIAHGSGYTDMELVASSSNVSLDISCSGTGTTTGVKFYAVSSGNYRNLFIAEPQATITGVQNYLTAGTGNPGVAPTLEARGGDTNINLDLQGKGTGSIRLNGTATTVSSTGFISTTKGFAAAEFSAGSGAPGTINWSNGQNQVRTLTSSGTMTFSTPLAGSTYKLRIVQGGAGSFTITWPTVKWAGGAAPTLTTTVGGEDIITLYYNGTSYYGQAATGFA